MAKIKALGAIPKLRRQARGGLAKCLCYYISLCSKLVYGVGVKNLQNPVYVVYEQPLTEFCTLCRLLSISYAFYTFFIKFTLKI